MHLLAAQPNLHLARRPVDARGPAGRDEHAVAALPQAAGVDHQVAQSPGLVVEVEVPYLADAVVVGVDVVAGDLVAAAPVHVGAREFALWRAGFDRAVCGGLGHRRGPGHRPMPHRLPLGVLAGPAESDWADRAELTRFLPFVIVGKWPGLRVAERQQPGILVSMSAARHPDHATVWSPSTPSSRPRPKVASRKEVSDQQQGFVVYGALKVTIGLPVAREIATRGRRPIDSRDRGDAGTGGQLASRAPHGAAAGRDFDPAAGCG